MMMTTTMKKKKELSSLYFGTSLWLLWIILIHNYSDIKNIANLILVERSMDPNKIRDFLRCHACNVDPGGVCPKCMIKCMSNDFEELLSKLSPASTKRYASTNVMKKTRKNVRAMQDESSRSVDLISNDSVKNAKPMHIYLYDTYMDDDNVDSNRNISEQAKKLRQKGLQFWQGIIESDHHHIENISLAGEIYVSGTLSGINSNQSEIFVKNLKTPQFTYPTAILRATDVNYIDFEINIDSDTTTTNNSGVRKNTLMDEMLDVQKYDRHNYENIAKNKTNDKKLVSINYNPSYEIKFQDPNAKEDMRKYWSQRFRFFSRFDDGIKTDTQGLFSVTAEAIAKYIAKTCSCNVIVDGFCGIGGNAIKFAMTCKHVIAIDIDPKKIEFARHNARIYNVEDKIDFIVGDFFELCNFLKADIVYLAPPWGGPKYSMLKEGKIKYIMKDTTYSNSGKDLVESGLKISKNIVVLLPKYANMSDLNIFPGVFHKLEYHYLNHKKKSCCMYGGRLFL